VIFDFINAVIKAGADTLHGIYQTLPQSPIYIPAQTQTELAGVFVKLAWFFPITGMLAFLALYFVAVFLLATVLLIKQLIEAAIP